ncbi:hypothetical protein [Phosphitispora fastidiosa]|uniref:hypothetical protein n=1 Tax=Phosphitispora fastidiosa TaxID=2837202 RepID=UPI001E2DA209|nr:hypothetical protein [Phosphitispora fastidiosa]MBU7005222.1 RNA polymerase subunit RPABC4/transcription elongation factor Spt4 [Phosphitispora fastidiosa]
MPWCPKCRRFQEEDDLCAYCWVETVPELDPEPEAEAEAETPIWGKAAEVLLVTVSDEHEADLIQALLESHNILTLRKYREGGQYLKVFMGVSRLGIDIFVLQHQLREAMFLINSEIAEDDDTCEYCEDNDICEDDNNCEDDDNCEDNGNSEGSEERGQMAKKLTWVILIPLIFGVLFSVWYLFVEAGRY